MDGKYHEIEDIKERDQKRTEDLQELNIVVYRITNEETATKALLSKSFAN